MSMEIALEQIKEGKGMQFDPDVVDAFFGIQDEIMAIKEKYSDDTKQSFDIPELKALLKKYSAEESVNKTRLAMMEEVACE